MSARLAALYRLRDRVDAAIAEEGGRASRAVRLRPLAAVRPSAEPSEPSEPAEPAPPAEPAALEDVVAAVCDRYAMTEGRLRKGMTREECDARQVVWLVLRWEDYTTSRIAEEFGRDHSSVCSSTKRASSMPALVDTARAVQADIHNNFARTA